ncbi:hypothetical protein RE428_24650 [Marinobacter nanhaiticus D15-8W]|uniref:DUF7673 domain-containing protein n=1 Tax=Marinobacter nanhaiticus D15-8W TaxID=626887 RepID=N6WR63_9GAMM|nr:hypothetical protein [Marinobacter nanhaiticus]ENO14066.1 hypothetical protein J057_21770 [Marinobacter nanhaiticus D15-8W]BES71447.1 hypothetical protein RE428_24650 [Marinobacter nanhaiticus D15-8W]
METEISTAIRGQISEAEVICSELSVTVGEYHQAIEALWTHAMAETGERRPASLVLLGAYDPPNWAITFSDLASLDYKLLKAALVVLRGRLVLGIEPHTMMRNGSNRLRQLMEEVFSCYTQATQ